MDERDSHCPYPPSSETTAKGTAWKNQRGKKTLLSFDSSLVLWGELGGVE